MMSFFSQAFSTGATAVAACCRRVSVSWGSYAELAITSGPMRAAARPRSSTFRSPAIRPARLSRTSGTCVSLSSVRSTVSRTRAASVRTPAQRSGVSAWSVVIWSAESAGIAALRSTMRSAGVTPSANAASIGLTRRSNAWDCWTAMASAWAAVKSYCGPTSLRAASRAASVRIALSYWPARGANTLDGAGLSTSSCDWAGRKSRPRITDIATTSTAAAAIRRPASRRVNRIAGSEVWVSIGLTPRPRASAPPRARTRPRGRAPVPPAPMRPCHRHGRESSGRASP